VLFAKLLNWLSGGKVNPMIGAAGISAFPMAARVVQRMAQEEDFENFLLMHAMGANAAGSGRECGGGRRVAGPDGRGGLRLPRAQTHACGWAGPVEARVQPRCVRNQSGIGADLRAA
jgi:hypothetical protein